MYSWPDVEVHTSYSCTLGINYFLNKIIIISFLFVCVSFLTFVFSFSLSFLFLLQIFFYNKFKLFVRKGEEKAKKGTSLGCFWFQTCDCRSSSGKEGSKYFEGNNKVCKTHMESLLWVISNLENRGPHHFQKHMRSQTKTFLWGCWQDGFIRNFLSNGHLFNSQFPWNCTILTVWWTANIRWSKAQLMLLQNVEGDV